MNYWNLIRNIGIIISFIRSFYGLIEGVAKNKEVPPLDQIKGFLDQAEALLDSGVTDIPNVDEKAISEALKQIEFQLTQKG